MGAAIVLSSSGELEDVLDTIYAGFTGVSDLRTALADLCSQLGLSGCSVGYRIDREITLLESTFYNSPLTPAFRRKIADLDPLYPLFGRNSPPSFVLRSQQMDLRSFAKTEFYEEFYKPIGLFEEIIISQKVNGNLIWFSGFISEISFEAHEYQKQFSKVKTSCNAIAKTIRGIDKSC